MPANTLNERITRATAHLSQRARVRQVLRSIREGDASTMEALCNGMPRKHYTARDLGEMGALQASERASLHLDRLAYRAIANTFHGLFLETETDNPKARDLARESAGSNAYDLATLAKAAQRTADRLGLDVSEAFAYSMVLDDSYFCALLEAYQGASDQTDVEGVTASLLAFWEGEEASVFRVA
jgi:hypothetical protein